MFHRLIKNYSFENIWLTLVSMYAIFIVYGSAIPNILFGVMLLIFIIGIFAKKVTINKYKLKWLLIFTSFYFIYLITLFYSDNIQYGLKKIALLSILFFTTLMLIVTREFFTSKKIFHIIQLSVISSILFAILSLASTTFEYVFVGHVDNSFFFENSLSTTLVDIHFLELSLYISFNIIALGYIRLFENRHAIKPIKYLFWPILIILIIFLILLNSRTTFATTLILLTSMLVVKGLKRNSYSLVLISISCFVLVLLGNYSFNESFRSKANEALNINNAYDNSKNWGGRGMRELIWNCSKKVIGENLIFGVGIGDQQDELTICYKKYRYGALLFKNNAYNSHNIFFQSLIQAGVIGFILYLISLVLPVINSYLNGNLLHVIFTLLFVLCGTTESFLQVNFGVTFFSFFNLMLFNLNYKNESITNT